MMRTHYGGRVSWSDRPFQPPVGGAASGMTCSYGNGEDRAARRESAAPMEREIRRHAYKAARRGEDPVVAMGEGSPVADDFAATTRGAVAADSRAPRPW